MQPQLFVVCASSPEGERFALFLPETFRPGVRFEDWQNWYRHAEALLTEPDIRALLAQMGLSQEAVDDQVRRARRVREAITQTTIERITRIGYTNSHSQKVRRKTNLPCSSPDQRVFVMRCGDCGHEYGSEGCDIHRVRCPRCQGGQPGLPTRRPAVKKQ